MDDFPSTLRVYSYTLSSGNHTPSTSRRVHQRESQQNLSQWTMTITNVHVVITFVHFS